MMRRSIYKILFVTALIAFLILIIPSVLFTPAHVESKMSVDTEKVVNNYYCRNDREGIVL